MQVRFALWIISTIGSLLVRKANASANTATSLDKAVEATKKAAEAKRIEAAKLHKLAGKCSATCDHD